MSTSALLCGRAGSVCCDLCECTAVVCRHPLYSVVRQVASVVICVSAQLCMSTSALLCVTAGSVCCDLCECTAVVCRHPLYYVVGQVASVVICVSAQLLYVDIRSTLL